MLFTVAITLGTMALLASRVTEFMQADAVTREMDAIYRGIVGDQRDTFGFVGDVGDYPASLVDLVVNPGLAGWAGPYVTDPRVANSVLLDPWNQPYEMYVVSARSGSDVLAVVTRGPDGLSTNTAANPNVAASFAGVVPTDPTYFSDPKNTDNRVFPLPNATQSDALNVNTVSTLAINIKNFDSNPSVQAFVPACPNLFSVAVTSTSRRTADVAATLYAPGFQVLLPQGSYRMVVTSAVLPTPPVNDGIVLHPVGPVIRNYNLTGLDSSGTPRFNLTVINNSPTQDIDVYSFNTRLGTVNGLTSRTFTPQGCVAITVFNKGQKTNPVNSYTMPYSSFTDNEYATAATLGVSDTQRDPVNVYDQGVLIGSVGGGKTTLFNKNLFAGDVITIKNQKTGVLLATLTLVAGANSITV